MEDHSRKKINSSDQLSFGTSETVKTQRRQNLAPHDRLTPKKPTLSDADLHHEIAKNRKDISPKCSRNFLKQCRKLTKEEELVKYMSNLPSYLERGENRQEKVLNVGVLDWGRLEKWQCRQKQIPLRSSRHSFSNANSSIPTEGSSVNSSRDQSCSPAHQMMRRPSLQSHLMLSPIEIQSQDAKSFEGSVQEIQRIKGAQTITINEKKFTKTDQLVSENFSEIKLGQSKRKDLDPKMNLECGIFNLVNFEVQQSMEVKTTKDGDFNMRENKLQEQKTYAFDQDVSQKSKRVLLLMPRDLSQGSHSQLSESTAMLYQKEAKASRRSFSEMPKDMSPAEVTSDVPHSCPLPREVEGYSEIKLCSSDAESISFLPNSCPLTQHPAKIVISPSNARISGSKKSTITPINSTSKEPSTGLDMKLSKATSEKPRSTSPFRRLGIGTGKTSKSFSSKEDSSIPQMSTTHHSAKAASENAMASSSQGISSSDMQNAASRARSSPLRRLLDPLWKPKAPNFRHSGELLRRNSVSADRICKSSNRRLDMASCREINIDNSSQDKKHGSSAFQALLRVTVKNGQPLFTFAVENERDILAATMKTLSSTREDDCSCIYTFFAIQEIRKKNGGWMNQGGKGKGHDYIPNVVAQLKVSGSQFSSWTRKNQMEQSCVREFVLFAVDLQQAEPQTLESQPNDELAAIVVKIPRVINRSTASDEHQTGDCNDLPEMRFNSTSAEQPIIYSTSFITTTVILPSGVHSLPNNGGPSSLIQRWRSGGSCDCGGWDVGCKLRIFANQSQLNKKSNLSKACSLTDKVELISQVGEKENQPVFSLAPFKGGIYSVEFTASFSTIQAFSLCIAVLDSKKLCENPEFCNLFEGKTSL